MAAFFFTIGGLGILMIVGCVFFSPKDIGVVGPIIGLKVFVVVRHGIRLKEEAKIRRSTEYVTVEQAMHKLAYARADVEHVLQNLPEGLQVSKRTKEIGFLRGGFRHFERVEIVGPAQTVLLDCIDGRVAGKRISVRVPTALRK